MTAVAAAHTSRELTHEQERWILTEAARLREDLTKDKRYQRTPLGRLVGKYLGELEFENYAPGTIEQRESLLARMSVALAHIDQLSVLTGDHLRAFLVEECVGLAPNTRKVYTSHVKVFFAWAHDHDHIPTNPGLKVKGPKARDVERHSHSRDAIRRLVMEQESERDRCALLVLYWCALRRNELRLIQFKHIDLAARLLTVFGKGSKIAEQHIPEPLGLRLESHILDRAPHKDEYLLHPQRIGRTGTYPRYMPLVTWEDRFRPLSLSGIDKWWQRCVERAGLPLFPMHEMRHTSGTHFYEESGDLIATQHFMRHASAGTTERTYIHTDRTRRVAAVQRVMSDPMEVA